jgi:hypothetical protein
MEFPTIDNRDYWNTAQLFGGDVFQVSVPDFLAHRAIMA